MIFPIHKLFRANRSHRKFQRDRLGRLKFELKIFLKRLIGRLFAFGDRMTARVKGFTLIELLISMLIASVIISTLLAFTVNIMETDRKEQAKVESQSDVQAALNYIADDMQETVYIYNADSLNANSPNGIQDQLPAFANSRPILVFWKRKYYAPTDTVNVGGGNTKAVGCLEYGTTTTNGTCNPNAPIGSGKYAYSLVAYYLIYDNATGANATWSNAARLGRWELNDGIRASCQLSDITTCAEPRPYDRIDVTPPPPAIPFSSMVNYWSVPDAGFAPFASTGGTVDALMNKWTKAPAAYATTAPTVLIDFLDDSPYSADQDDGTLGNTPAGNPVVDIPIRENVAGVPVGSPSTNADCMSSDVGTGGPSASQRIPNSFAGMPSSFYVCVNSAQNVARIYLRANTLARLRPNQAETQRRVFDSTYLSTGNIRAFGRGKVFAQ
ncbi:MAG: hormogonium polysaccharide secretion pseudopilin HpsC [Pseudanabaena sp.]|jgi:prepilin-type N-terminal cleavage/methylation domain-containing protein